MRSLIDVATLFIIIIPRSNGEIQRQRRRRQQEQYNESSALEILLAETSVRLEEILNSDPNINEDSAFFNLHTQPWFCTCFNASTFDVEFGDAISLCTTGEDICIQQPSIDGGDTITFQGLTFISDVFNYSNIENNQTFNGALSNTPIGYFTQQCFQYTDLYDSHKICLNFDETLNECGVQVEQDRCESCNWCGPYRLEASCRNINPNYYVNSCNDQDNLLDTMLRFYHPNVVSSVECFQTEPPKLTPCQLFELDLNSNLGQDEENPSEPWTCQCDENHDVEFSNLPSTTTASCTTGEIVCVRETSSILKVPPFAGVFHTLHTYNTNTEVPLANYKCFDFVDLYNSSKVCFGTKVDDDNNGLTESTAPNTCMLSVNNVSCTTCNFCDAEKSYIQANCTNLRGLESTWFSGSPNLLIDQCKIEEVDILPPDTIFRFLSETLEIAQGCPLAAVLYDMPYQGVWKMSNQLSNIVSVYRSADYGFLDPVGGYKTGGVGYPFVTTKNQLTNLGSSNSIIYHAWRRNQWTIAVNAGGPNNETSVSVTSHNRDLSPRRNASVVTPVQGKFPCSVSAYTDRVCVLGCGGNLTVDCFQINLQDDTLVLEQQFDFGFTIANNYFEHSTSTFGKDMQGGANIEFSPDGKLLAILFKGSLNQNGISWDRVNPPGLIIIRVNRRQVTNPPYGDYTFLEIPHQRAPCSFTWGEDTSTLFIVNTMAEEISDDNPRPTSTLSVIKLVEEADGNIAIRESGIYDIDGSQSCWIAHVNNTVYTANYNNYGRRGSITTITIQPGTDPENNRTIMVPVDSGKQVFMPEGLAVLDLVVSGTKIVSRHHYLYVDLYVTGNDDTTIHQTNKIGAFEISNVDGSLSLIGFRPYPAAWYGSAGLAVTTLSEQNLEQQFPEPTRRPTSPPVPPPTNPPVTKSGALSSRFLPITNNPCFLASWGRLLMPFILPLAVLVVS